MSLVGSPQLPEVQAPLLRRIFSPQTASKKQRPTLGLALGGGGAKGLAHIGVLKVLTENGIQFDYVAGTSVGALVGSLFAVTGDMTLVDDLITLREDMKFTDYIGMISRRASGVINTAQLAKILQTVYGNRSFSECKIPFQAVAVNIQTGDVVRFNEGKLIDAVTASFAIPYLFTPVKGGEGVTYVDGGLAEPIPVPTLKAMGADRVIAINLADYFSEQGESKLKLGQFSSNVLNTMKRHLTEAMCYEADVVISPAVGNPPVTDLFTDKDLSYLIAEGEKAARAALPGILALKA